MNIKITKSTYKTKENKRAIIYDCSAKNYRKKINTGVLVDEEIVSDVEFFNIYLPFIYYENSTGTTVGAEFKMDETDYYLDSTVAGTPGDIRTKYVKFRYILDEIGKKVGKVFVDKKVIVFDDQEIVALLDYRSNRRYTLPTPKVYHLPSDGVVNEADVNI